MNNAPFIGAHRLKRKRRTRLANAIRREVRHRLKLSFAGSAKSVDIADQTRGARKTTSKHLINYVLQRFEEFSGLSLEELGVFALDIQHFAADALLHSNAQLQTSCFEYVLEIMRCLLRNLSHSNHPHVRAVAESMGFFRGGAFFTGVGVDSGSSSSLVQWLIRNCCEKPTMLPTSQYKTKPDGALHRTYSMNSGIPIAIIFLCNGSADGAGVTNCNTTIVPVMRIGRT